jgi:ubiquinone/menaquinone biosynthesis C-methylase UbiE
MRTGLGQLTLAEWHARFTQQAGWTAEVRRHLFEQADVKPGSRVLEVGCGTGAVMGALAEETNYHLTGVDLDHPSLQFNRAQFPLFPLTQADGHKLPFADGAFDAVYCHYLLLWVADPGQALAEMRRVTRPGGVVIALAEPDYAGRVDFPPPLDELGWLQTKALSQQGANPEMGSQLKGLFEQAGFFNIYSDILEAQWDRASHPMAPLEWRVLRSDLDGLVTEKDLDQFAALDRDARQYGERVLFIPTFYAIGWVK